MPHSDITPIEVKRIAVGIEYDGAAFSGWQKQLSPQQPTIQQQVEKALSQIVDEPIVTTCAGRTDSGVHATCQVIHFDTPVDRGSKAWLMGGNSLLPDSIRIQWSRSVSDDFHARFSATARRYFYVIHQRDIASAILSRRVTHVRETLDLEAMQVAAQHLLGEKDFSSFRAAGCQSKSASRNVMQARVFRQGAFIVLDIQADAFLQHMVRNIVGSLLEVGRGQRPVDWIAELLAEKDRRKAAMTASPHGLYLVEVDYPPEFGLPSGPRLPSFLESV